MPLPPVAIVQGRYDLQEHPFCFLLIKAMILLAVDVPHQRPTAGPFHNKEEHGVDKMDLQKANDIWMLEVCKYCNLFLDLLNFPN